MEATLRPGGDSSLDDVDLSRKIELLDQQVAAANNGDPADFDDWRSRTRVIIRHVMGENSQAYVEFGQVSYSPIFYSPDVKTDPAKYRVAGVKRAITILEAAKQELELRAEIEDVVESDETPAEREAAVERGRVFIVHGHDDGRKYELAGALQALTGTRPVILHEQANAGLTIIEKLEESAASAGFAVVLLTADDLGRAKADTEDRPRARQNVLFEAGYFAGRLGRAGVVLLYEDGVEVPSDLAGVLFIPLDASGAWKTKVAFEMKAYGIDVDLDALAGQ